MGLVEEIALTRRRQVLWWNLPRGVAQPHGRPRGALRAARRRRGGGAAPPAGGGALSDVMVVRRMRCTTLRLAVEELCFPRDGAPEPAWASGAQVTCGVATRRGSGRRAGWPDASGPRLAAGGAGRNRLARPPKARATTPSLVGSVAIPGSCRRARGRTRPPSASPAPTAPERGGASSMTGWPGSGASASSPRGTLRRRVAPVASPAGSRCALRRAPRRAGARNGGAAAPPWSAAGPTRSRGGWRPRGSRG